MKTVLIVEDSDTVRTELKSIIEDAGHKALLADNGAEGLELFQNSTDDIALVLSDIYMPVMDGLDMCEQIMLYCKSKSKIKAPNILMITTETNQSMKEKAREIGVSGWILKPFESDAVSTAITNILSSKK